MTDTITTIQCPTCKGNPYGAAWIYCPHCGGRGWITEPDPVKEDFQITINPMDLTLSLRLDRLEEKLDRLLAALEDTS